MSSHGDLDFGETVRRRWEIRGQVQGVGLRPFVYRLAQQHGLCGFVCNDGWGATIEVQGPSQQVSAFAGSLVRERPPLARIEYLYETAIPPAPDEGRFEIAPSTHREPRRSPNQKEKIHAQVTIDTGVCADCLKELADQKDRRYRYGLINCTNCGPRYTILRHAPYDRAHTTMSGFEMCGACRSQYVEPSDRRFHAQPIACPGCGPKVELVDAQGKPIGGDPYRRAADTLRCGRVVAIKGLGGFHLAVRADDEAAVMRLRQLKERQAKPFAVMVASIDEARGLVELGDRAAEVMQSPAAPVMLARRRPGAGVAKSVAPNNHRLGVMLPYTPIHHLVLRESGLANTPLVMTSGNLSDEPLAIDNQEAIDRLGRMCDVILWHDRPIERCVDDSVLMDMGLEEPLPIRRSRGYVPAPLPLPVVASAAGLCVGGLLKNTVAVVRDGGAILGQHLGDLTHPLAYDYFKKAIQDLRALFGIEPRWIAHDLHPAYLSTIHAQELAGALGVPLIGVQHHHAHAASVLAEHDCRGPALAVVCDGVGYGQDNTVWGGELLLADFVGFRRLARLRPMVLPGGDAAAQDTRRCALAMLYQALGDDFDRHPAVERLIPDPAQKRVLTTMIRRHVNCVLSSSAGRVFDGVAAMLGLCQHNQFEAQAGVAVEAAAEAAASVVSHRKPLYEIRDDPAAVGLRQIDLSPFVQYLLTAIGSGAPTAELAGEFHEQLAAAWAAVVSEAVERTGVRDVVLSGGVFCNQRLTKRLSQRLTQRGLHVMRHRMVPPNDGGLSLGQAAVAAARLADASRTKRIANVSIEKAASLT